MIAMDQAFSAMSDFQLWRKNLSGTPLMMSDIPEIIRMRWAYLRDNWKFLKPKLVLQIDAYIFPETLQDHINKMSRLIETTKETNIINPFSGKDSYLRYYAIFDSIAINDLTLSREEQIIVDNNRRRVSTFIRRDFETMRANLAAARDILADQVGHSDATYDSTYGRRGTIATRSIKTDDIRVMAYLQDTVVAIDYVIANAYALPTLRVDPFILAKQNANNPDFNMAAYQSGKLVRLNYGESLQSLAYRYLGDPDKWVDIAVANGLQPPYVDELGIAIPIVGIGTVNAVSVGKYAPDGGLNRDKLYVGQRVSVQSYTYPGEDVRLITRLQHIPISENIVVELSGEQDLDRFSGADGATLRVYAPSTVSSGVYVLIPSTEPVTSLVTTTPFFLKMKAEDEKRAGVDLQLSDDNDLVLNSTNDLMLSYGTANAMQAMMLKIMIEKGSLVRHPAFGLSSGIGTRSSDVADAQQTIVTSIESMVSADSRFDSIESLNVQYGNLDTGNGFKIELVVRMAGTGSRLPISFTVNVN